MPRQSYPQSNQIAFHSELTLFSIISTAQKRTSAFIIIERANKIFEYEFDYHARNSDKEPTDIIMMCLIGLMDIWS